MLYLFELFFVTISKSFLLLVEDCLYVTCDLGFVIGETAYSLCRYDGISAEVDVLSKTVNLTVNVHNVTVCFQQHIPICAFKAVL